MWSAYEEVVKVQSNGSALSEIVKIVVIHRSAQVRPKKRDRQTKKFNRIMTSNRKNYTEKYSERDSKGGKGRENGWKRKAHKCYQQKLNVTGSWIKQTICMYVALVRRCMQIVVNCIRNMQFTNTKNRQWVVFFRCNSTYFNEICIFTSRRGTTTTKTKRTQPILTIISE